MMDDILIHGVTHEEHDQRLQVVLQRLSDLGMTLNAEICTFSQTSVKFLGHVVDSQGIRPDPDKVEAVVRFTTPTSMGEVRRFLGMVNQLSKFSPNLADGTHPLTWVWEDTQQQAFETVTQMLVASPVLALFNANLETILATDASSYGLGAVLLQKQVMGQLLPVAYISRSMTPTERRYVQIEKEAFTFTWACKRLSDYLVGLQFHIQTDHKPLIPLFSSKDLKELPVRVQRFQMRMMQFDFTISHVPGNELTIADALSRAPVSTSSAVDQSLQSETTSFLPWRASLQQRSDCSRFESINRRSRYARSFRVLQVWLAREENTLSQSQAILLHLSTALHCKWSATVGKEDHCSTTTDENTTQ